MSDNDTTPMEPPSDVMRLAREYTESGVRDVATTTEWGAVIAGFDALVETARRVERFSGDWRVRRLAEGIEDLRDVARGHARDAAAKQGR